MDHDSVTAWVAGYEAAWRSGDLDALDSLFTADAVYRRSPYFEPDVGLDAIKSMWLGDAGFTMSSAVVAVEENRAVVSVGVTYGDPPRQEFRDLWVLRFGDNDLVDDFVEWPFWPGQRISPGDAGGEPASGERVRLAVVGAHLMGQPLNHQLTDRDAVLVAHTTTAPSYRLYALDTTPPKPGLVRVDPSESGASAIAVEVWELGLAEFGSFVAEVPSPLGVGRVRLADGTEVSGFVCEAIALAGAPDITPYGGWRAYLAR